MKYLKFCELDVSRIGLGAMGMSHGYTGPGTDEAESVRTLHRALELGVTLIDTAEIYGPFTNEELLGPALTGRRDQVVLATSFGLVSAGEGPWNLDSSLADIRTAVEGSLKRLGADRIDRNLRLADEVQAVAAEAGATPAQVAPAWLLAPGDDIAPVPGPRLHRGTDSCRARRLHPAGPRLRSDHLTGPGPPVYQDMADHRVLKALIAF